MENTIKKHLVLKILLALLPTLIFWQNYAWMTLNSYLGIAFLIIWALMIWNVYHLTGKNHIIERLFRLTEISFFLLPLSAIVFSFVLGSKAVSSTTNEFEQAGAALGTAIGGTFIVILSFIIGLAGGVIMHLITNKYEKKAEASDIKQRDSLSNKHGVILSLVSVIMLATIMGSISSVQSSVAVIKEKEELSNSFQQGETNQNNTLNSEQNKIETIKPVFIESTEKPVVQKSTDSSCQEMYGIAMRSNGVGCYCTGNDVKQPDGSVKCEKIAEQKQLSPEGQAKQEAEGTAKNVPAEYKSALNKATSYSNTMHMSKQGVYDQLVSEYGGKFIVAAAQYAIDNVRADWNANALAKAKSYQDTMNMSPAGIHDQLVSEYGARFTEEEADYAIQHLND